MPNTKTSREKKYWLWACIVVAGIFASLFIGRPLANRLTDQNTQAVFFVTGMLLVGATVIVHGLKKNTGKFELSLLLGIVAVYGMFIFRLGAPERSHIIEYGVLAVFIHKALLERVYDGKFIFSPAVLALFFSILIGVIDESIQFFLPNRVFDPQDILFNGMAASLAIASTLLLNWAHKKGKRSKINGKKG